MPNDYGAKFNNWRQLAFAKSMAIVFVTGSHEKEEINFSKLIIRSKRDNNEIVIQIEGHDDLLFQSNDINVQWYSNYGLNWILNIGASSCNTILNWWKNDPSSPENKINKFAIISKIIVVQREQIIFHN